MKTLINESCIKKDIYIYILYNINFYIIYNVYKYSFTKLDNILNKIMYQDNILNTWHILKSNLSFYVICEIFFWIVD